MHIQLHTSMQNQTPTGECENTLLYSFCMHVCAYMTLGHTHVNTAMHICIWCIYVYICTHAYRVWISFFFHFSNLNFCFCSLILISHFPHSPFQILRLLSLSYSSSLLWIWNPYWQGLDLSFYKITELSFVQDMEDFITCLDRGNIKSCKLNPNEVRGHLGLLLWLRLPVL